MERYNGLIGLFCVGTFGLALLVAVLVLIGFFVDFWEMYRGPAKKKETPPEPKKLAGETGHPFRANARVESLALHSTILT